MTPGTTKAVVLVLLTVCGAWACSLVVASKARLRALLKCAVPLYAAGVTVWVIARDPLAYHLWPFLFVVAALFALTPRLRNSVRDRVQGLTDPYFVALWGVCVGVCLTFVCGEMRSIIVAPRFSPTAFQEAQKDVQGIQQMAAKLARDIASAEALSNGPSTQPPEESESRLSETIAVTVIATILAACLLQPLRLLVKQAVRDVLRK